MDAKLKTAGLLAAVATIALLGAARSAWSETISIPNAFDVDLADLLPGVHGELQELGDRARRPGECPDQIKIKVFVHRGGDTVFLKTLAWARWLEIWNFYKRLGLRPGQLPGQDAYDIDITGASDDVQVSREPLPDKASPKLQVTWNPPSGKKVKAGDQIRADITATDNANAWETGILNIQLRANGELIDHQLYNHEAYGGPQSKCEPQRRTRTWWRIYTVPRRPPPIVRLEVLSEDFVGNPATPAVGEFPTTDWYGQLDYSLHQRLVSGTQEWKGQLDLTVDHDGQGNLTGRFLGSETQTLRLTGCSSDTGTPGRLEGKLTGSYTPGRRTMSLQFSSPQWREPQVTPCPSGMPGIGRGNASLPTDFPNLEPTDDGGFRAQREWTEPYGGYPYRVRYTLKLRPAVQ